MVAGLKETLKKVVLRYVTKKLGLDGTETKKEASVDTCNRYIIVRYLPRLIPVVSSTIAGLVERPARVNART